MMMFDAGVLAVARRHLESSGLEVSMVIPDVQVAIDASRRPQKSLGEAAAGSDSGFALDEYHRYNDIVDWMERAAARADDAGRPAAGMIEIGSTIEHRTVKGLKINVAAYGARPKPIIILVCGMHAREWIGPASCLYVADRLVRGRAGPEAEAFEWHIVPVLNADGYEFSHTQDRMWRKNRRRLGGFLCGMGVDLERNFNWASCQEDDEQLCFSSAYCGGQNVEKPSEPETKGLVKYLRELTATGRHIGAFLDIHSFSQLWMWPWGYTEELVPARDARAQARCGVAAADALYKVHNTSFTTGPIASTIYQVGGSSVDWTYGRLNITHSYAVELRDQGEYGFLLPEDQILSSGEELLAGLNALAACVAAPEAASHEAAVLF